MKCGLRIDVDTFRGTRLGAPDLSRLLADKAIQASFFFSVGPDNMGRHLRRLVNPVFLWKMLRSNAPGLYGWSILLRGALWPGPVIGQRLAPIIRQTAKDGHQMGFHAWDHQAWQAKIEFWDRKRIHAQYHDGVTLMTEILGRAPTCSAAPSWRSCEMALSIEEQFPFEYNSDCRGSAIFMPVLADASLAATVGALQQPQVPVTLPTYDEVVGTNGMTGPGYYESLLSLLDPSKLNVLTIHAEVEGMSRLQDFARFVTQAQQRGWSFVPLSDLIGEQSTLPHHHIVNGSVTGREGWVSCQARESLDR